MELAKVKKVSNNKSGNNSDSVAPLQSEANIPIQSSEDTATEAVAGKRTLTQRDKKVIKITPYTELDRQQQQRQQQRRNAFGTKDQPPKVSKRANQILNHIIYSCQRCHRDTELPGTKEGYLTSRVKVTKPVSHRRKLSKEQVQQKAAKEVVATATTISASLGNSTPPKHGTAARQGVKRKAPSPLTAASSDFELPKHAASMPSSPVGRLSMASSIASSAATSPGASPRLPGLDEKKGGGAGSKKKKKGGLASLLASQKSNGPSSDPGNAAGGSGDSVLANFLMGL